MKCLVVVVSLPSASARQGAGFVPLRARLPQPPGPTIEDGYQNLNAAASGRRHRNALHILNCYGSGTYKQKKRGTEKGTAQVIAYVSVATVPTTRRTPVSAKY